MNAGRWKRQEREIAAALGGVRLPNSGRGQCDVRCPGYAVQVKTRKAFPAWLLAAVAQARNDADPGELPVVVLSEVRPGVKARRLVVIEFETWQAMMRAEHAEDAD